MDFTNFQGGRSLDAIIAEKSEKKAAMNGNQQTMTNTGYNKE